MDLRNQEYFFAARAGDLDSIKRLVEGVAQPGVGIDGRPEKIDAAGLSSLLKLQNEAKQTGLYIAAENNYEEMFRYLLKRCDYQTAVLPSNLGITAFHVAAKKGNTGIVREFLSTWPEICKICDGTNTSPLYSAAVLNHLDIVNAILDVDPGSIRILRKNGKTALHTTARIGFLQMSKTLINRDQGIVPIIDKKGQTALHMAVKGHEPAILDIIDEMLIISPSILNGRDKKGNTPLLIATRKMRAQIVRLLLCYPTIELNAINNQKQTAMDLAEKSSYNGFSIDIKDSLREAGAKNAQNVGKANEASELRRTVSDIKHNVHTQLIQNAQTNKRVTGIAKELQKLHREAVQNTINSVTLVAVLIASIAFISIFDLPGQYIASFGEEIGKSNIADTLGFHLFFLLNATALFISLAVVVIQITLVAWETGAQKLVVSIMNKLMWAACVGTLGAFLSLAFVVVGKSSSWMAITITAIGVPMMVGTLGLMCYMVFRQRCNDDSQRRIKRSNGGSRSFSWSLHSAALSDAEAVYSDHERIYAL